MTIVVGGTYDEFCFEPRWNYKFGSGLRGCLTINALETQKRIDFFTFGNEKVEAYLNQLTEIGIYSTVKETPFSVKFEYDFPLSTPQIFPRPDILANNSQTFEVTGSNILYYGMLEGAAKVEGQKVVYDPQSPSNPIPFSKTGSKAEKLAIVVNLNEAKKISKIETNDFSKLKEYFFKEEGAVILIIKMGARGALVLTPEGIEEMIPVYETPNVWNIGSGDVFAASFAYYWFNDFDLVQAAQQASWNTALYCNSKALAFQPINSDSNISELKIKEPTKKQIYLAGPFFTYMERWLINQAYHVLRNMGLQVFSPWHDVGHGEASVVVPMDLKGLDDSHIVFAILDGLDSGTLFEVGYAISKGIPVIGYVENETSENTKMLEGTGCILEHDLTTALYKTLWEVSK